MPPSKKTESQIWGELFSSTHVWDSVFWGGGKNSGPPCMFLETEAAFPYYNWSIKMARIIWFGLTSVEIVGLALVNSWQR